MRCRRWTVGLLAVLALAGCTTQTAGSPTAQSPLGTSSAKSTPAGKTEVATSGDASFSSPTGNIGCIVYDKLDVVSARCDIQQKRWQPPPKPADCPFDWGQGVDLGDTARIVCAGDTALGGTQKLAYGDAQKVGRFLCTSRESGMRCENTQTKHGFELSQESYKVF